MVLLTWLAGSNTLTAQPPMESAAEAVKNMRVGWNLGNTLDSNSGDTLNMWIEHWTDRSPAAYEKAWGQEVVTPELMKMMKDGGFNAIRVPVTWYPHMEAKFNFPTWENSYWYPSKDDLGTKVDRVWMKRVHEVVDYIVSQGMYCILNVHHDTGAGNTTWLVADNEVYQQQRGRYESLWKQIATEFRDYDEHLLFEGYNEMLDSYDSWCFASFATPSRYDAQVASDAYAAINNYAQSFVDAVRSTGGNNATRNLVVCTYGACSAEGNWSGHLTDPIREMKLPQDETEGHIIFEVHTYPSVANLASAKTSVAAMVKNLNTHLVSKGAPVIFGEWGSSDWADTPAYQASMTSFCEYFVDLAKKNNMGTFYWMGMSDGADRSVPQWTQEWLKDAIMRGYYGADGYDGIGDVTDVQPRICYSIDGSACQQPARGVYVRGSKKILGTR